MPQCARTLAAEARDGSACRREMGRVGVGTRWGLKTPSSKSTVVERQEHAANNGSIGRGRRFSWRFSCRDGCAVPPRPVRRTWLACGLWRCTVQGMSPASCLYLRRSYGFGASRAATKLERRGDALRPWAPAPAAAATISAYPVDTGTRALAQAHASWCMIVIARCAGWCRCAAGLFQGIEQAMSGPGSSAIVQALACFCLRAVRRHT